MYKLQNIRFTKKSGTDIQTYIQTNRFIEKLPPKKSTVKISNEPGLEVILTKVKKVFKESLKKV